MGGESGDLQDVSRVWNPGARQDPIQKTSAVRISPRRSSRKVEERTPFMGNRVISTVLVLAAVAAVSGGCSDRGEEKRKIRKLEGIAVKVDLANNDVSMRVVNKRGKEQIFNGTLRENTVVIINGRDESAENINPGDKVVVFGYREGEGDQLKLVATKVIVTRPTGTDWKKTGKKLGDEDGKATPPSTNPAEKPAATQAAKEGDHAGQPAPQDVKK